MYRAKQAWRRCAAFTIASAMLFNATTATHASGGIPVVDGASIADRAVKHAETMLKYAEQIGVLKDQLDNQRRQLESITGVRNLGDILNNPAIRSALPVDARVILRQAESGDFEAILRRIEREERLTGNYETDRKNLDNRAEQLALRSQALSEQIQKGMTARMQQISQLQAQINMTQDPKAIADLQARLMVEQANVQVDQTRADMLQRQLEAEKALLEAQAEKIAASSLSIDAIHAPLPGVR